MASYYVNNKAQPNGDHEVHVQGCSYLPSDRKPLGDYATCAPAVTEAKKTHTRVNGCYYCCNPCHTT